MRRLLRVLSAPLRWPARWIWRRLPDGLRAIAGFELRSFVGRRRARRLVVDIARTPYLNLGAADDRLPGFVAVDFFGNPNVYGADLRYPLLIDDESFVGIFCEHTLEHLDYATVRRVLAECRRILRPGGRIRVVVPDVSLFARHYVDGDLEWFREWERESLVPRQRRMISPMEAISFITQEYGHRSAWDFETLRLFLAEAGFVEVERRAFGEGADPALIGDKAIRSRTLVSLYVEAVKASNAPPRARDAGHPLSE